MKLICIALTAIWLILSSAELAYGDPVTTAIFGAAFAATTAGGFVSLGILMAVNLGVGLIAKARAKAKAKDQTNGISFELQVGDDQPMSLTVGKFAAGGRRKYTGIHGQDGRYFVDVIELESVPNPGRPEIWVNDQEVTIDWDHPNENGFGCPVHDFDSGSQNTVNFWVIYHDGSQTAPDPYLRSKFGSEPDRPFTADMIGRGCPYLIVTARFHPETFPSVPNVLTETPIRPFYDLRKDSTNGGSGAHRWNNQATWEPTQNPIIIIYNIIRGIYYGDEWVYGGQNLAAFHLPASNWIAAANECDVNITLSGGGTEKQFRCGYEIFCDVEPLTVIEELLQTCSGRLAEVGGIFKVLVGAPGAAVFSFTDDDVIITEGQSFNPFPPFSDTHNGIEATYPEPAEKWASKDAPPRYSETYMEADLGQQLVVGVSFDAVPFKTQVQRLMKTMLKEERRFRSHEFHLPPSAWRLEPNDVVSWTSERNGYINKKFLVVSVVGRRTFNQLISLKEIDPSDYDWAAGEELPTVVGPVKPIIPEPQVMSGWTATPYTVLDTDGRSRRPGIKVTATANLDDVKNVRVTVRLKSTQVIVFDSDATPYGAPYEWVISGQWTLPNTIYEAQGLFVPFTNREMVPSAWLTVTTPNAQFISDDVLDGAIISAKIAEAAITASKIMDEAVTNLKLAEAAVTATKIAVAAVTSDALALGSVIGSKIADAAVTGAKMAAATIDATKFAASIEPVTVVTGSLPTTRITGAITYLGVMYRWNGTEYTVAVAAGEITGQIIGSQIADLAITNPKLAAAAVDSTKLATNAVTNTKIADDAISTPKLQANSVVASVIAAQAIAARHLILADFENLIANGDFTDNSVTSNYWGLLVGTSTLTYVESPSLTGVRYLRLQKSVLTGSVSAYMTPAYDIPVVPGEVFSCECAIKGNVAASQGAYVRFIWVTAGKVFISQNDLISDHPITTSWVNYSSKFTAPATAAFVRLQIYNHSTNTVASQLDFNSFIMRRANAAKLIVDGTIITNMLQSGAITADKLGANSVIAGKVQAGAISTAELAAGAVITSKLAAGSVVADKLAVGTSNNLIPNADFSAGTTGWSMAVSGGTWAPLSIRTDQFAIPTGSLEVMQQADGLNGYYADVTVQDPATNSFRKFTTTPGKKYEISFYAYGHRGDYIRMHIAWMNAAGTVFAYDWVDVPNHQNSDPVKNIANYTRNSGMATAPTGAVSCYIMFRVWGNTVTYGQNAYAWIAQPYFGAAQPNQTEPSVWSSGVTTLITDGNIITGSVNANKLVALSITATQIAVGAITAAKIQAGTITATEIAGSTITGAKIAANTIGATNIAAQAITAKHLVLTDFNNLVPDNQMLDWTGNTWTFNASWGAYNDPNLFTSNCAWVYVGPFGSGGYTGAGNNVMFPVKPSTQYRCIGQSYSNNNYNCLIRVLWYDGNGTYITYADFLNTGAIGPGGVTGNNVLTSPSNARKAKIEFYVERNTSSGNVYFGGIGVFERNGASLIVDGSIVGGQITGNTITGGHIVGGSITADKLNVTSLSAISATLGSVNISNAIIGTLMVGGANITAGEITGVYTDTLAGGAWAGGNRDVSISVPHGTGSPKVTIYGMGGQISGGVTGVGNWTLSCRTTAQITGLVQGTPNVNAFRTGLAVIGVHTPGSGVSSTTYTVRMTGGEVSNAQDMTIVVQVLKR